MGRPIPRFNRPKLPSQFGHWSRAVNTTPDPGDGEDDADFFVRNWQRPLPIVYPYRGQPTETRIATRPNPRYRNELAYGAHEVDNHSMMTIPPWRTNELAYTSYDESYGGFYGVGPWSAGDPIDEHRDPRLRISETAESAQPPHEFNDTSPGENLQEDYRAALRLIIANLLMNDIGSREQNIRNRRENLLRLVEQRHREDESDDGSDNGQ